MITQSDHDRLTLQQYLQTYNIRKKIEQRKKSKSKNKDPIAISQQQLKVTSIFATMDQFLEQTKIDLEDILLNTDIMRDKIFFYLSKLIDELVVKLKDEISKMYKDVYQHYLIQSKDGQTNINKEAENYFKDKMKNAIEQKKHSNLGQVIKQNFKKDDKNAFITKLIIGDHLKNDAPFFMDNNVKSKIDEKQLRQRQDGEKKKKLLESEKRRQIKQNNQIKKSIQLKVPTNEAKKPAPGPEPRMNSFFQALFGGFKEQTSNTTVTEASPAPSPVIKTEQEKPPVIKERPLPAERDSKISRPFERKPSMREILNSPKAKKIFKGASPY